MDMRHWKSGHTITISGCKPELLGKKALSPKLHKLFWQFPPLCNTRSETGLIRNTFPRTKPKDVSSATEPVEALYSTLGVAH